ncbi:hypothetical protein [Sphingomonas sp. KR3-1]|uniref:hypothetical protein n=1 Tax=Sphingomonas sp. KR3-1 TaxID=3156611 RepID=UPI0032B312E8
MRVEIVAEPSAALLCRLIGLAAQLDLAAPDMTVRNEADAMLVSLELHGVERQMGAILAEKMRRCIGVATLAVAP